MRRVSDTGPASKTVKAVVQSSQASAGTVLHSPGNDSNRQFKILIADDSQVYRKLVESVLTPEGYTIYFARNGREALDTLAEHHPSLLITDWEMPDLTGIELCKEVRGYQDYIYTILLTSKMEKGQIIEGLAAGADDYLTKPFYSGELVARVAVGRRVADLHRQLQAKNMLLETLARSDPLTGLPNRRALVDWASRELHSADRHGFTFWLVMADLDCFKNVNDTYGHETGDVVLKKFAQLLAANTRASDMCARLGGEEFVLAVAHADKTGITIVVDRIRQQFEAERFSFGASVLGATASFGIAGFYEGETPDFERLLRNADEALYAAKRNGRNRFEFARL